MISIFIFTYLKLIILRIFNIFKIFTVFWKNCIDAVSDVIGQDETKFSVVESTPASVEVDNVLLVQILHNEIIVEFSGVLFRHSTVGNFNFLDKVNEVG